MAGLRGRVVVQFAVAALSERRILLKKKPAVRDRRYNKTKLNHYRQPGFASSGCLRCRGAACSPLCANRHRMAGVGQAPPQVYVQILRNIFLLYIQYSTSQ